MIDYVKIFKDTINKNFETLATEAREKHPRVYSKQDTQDTAQECLICGYHEFLSYFLKEG